MKLENVLVKSLEKRGERAYLEFEVGIKNYARVIDWVGKTVTITIEEGA